MMYRVKLRSKTGYFRNDLTITGIQETYDCPPLSTIYGIISSAAGEKIDNIDVGYVFNYKYKVEDFELMITEGAGDKSKYKQIKEKDYIDRHDILQGCFASAPVLRQILFDCTLYIYINDINIANYFKQPYYTMLMGRSEDICTVEEVKEIELTKKQNITAGKTIIPLNDSSEEIYGKIASLPIRITYDIPRRLMNTDIYIITKDFINIKNNNYTFLYDNEIKLGIYIHKFKN